jgi:glutaredoxin
MGDIAGRRVTVYWRPGCIFCAGLFHSMTSAGIAHERINIWEDPEAAAFVRSVAGGNETVPTVTVGAEAFVNPTVEQVAVALN